MNEKDEWVTGQIKITIAGHPLDMSMTVPATPVPARRMLPIFQKMANSFVKLGVDAVEGTGEKISCKAGCGACCRQAVPLSEIEAFEIANMVQEMPEPRRSEIIEKFKNGVEQLTKAGWFEKLEKTVEMTKEGQQKVITDYFYEGIPCPFLENESCSIHEKRPLACREYLVTSPPEKCKTPSPEIKGVKLPIKASTAVCSITRSDNLHPAINFVPLILSLEWAEKLPEKPVEKTGEEWMADFFGIFSNSEIPKY